MIFIAIVLALAFGAGYLMDASGGVTIAFGTVEFTLQPIQAAIALVLLVLAVWLLIKLFGLLVAVLRFINGDETAFSRFFSRSRERRGYDALSDGLVALASGDGATAMSKAKKASKLLNKPEVTNLVMAQAAEATGDKRKAEETYKKLLDSPKTRFVGVSGLLQQKLAKGETDTALKLAEKAFAIKPQHAQTGDVLLKLQAGEEDWNGVRTTLGTKLKNGQIPRDVHRRRDGVFALSEARKLREAGKLDEAHVQAIEANRLTPGLVPAATMAARGYMEKDQPKQAAKVLRSAWDQSPHPELASAFAAIMPDETPVDRAKRFRGLTKGAAKHSETKMLTAELLIAAEDFAGARNALGDLVETDPTTRSLTIMAAIERGEGASDDVVREWLTKALSAQRNEEWICDNCGDTHNDWEPVCLNCDAVDSVTWKRPSATVQGAAQMLPLMANAPQIAAETDAADAVEVVDGDNVILLETEKGPNAA